MNSPESGRGRLRAYLEFIFAVLYFFFARAVARRAAVGMVQEQWTPLVEQMAVVLLLVVGYALAGFWLDGQSWPVSAQGLPRRQGWPKEAAIGMVTGWGLAVVCVIPLTLAGGIAIVLSTQASAWAWLLADAAFFGLLALGEEVAFRGYGFQRFSEAVGPVGAVVAYAAFYGIVQAQVPGANKASIFVAIVLSMLLATAYLRSRALWLSWGLNFGWKASRALLFGLAVSGVNSHSPVVQGDPMGPFWLTGGGFGLDGSWVVFLVLLAAFPLVYRVTRDLNYRYNMPEIVPGGIAVDLDAAARRQHEAAMGKAEPAAPTLVTILPASTPVPITRTIEGTRNGTADSE
jgi:membrane protease YdiL (CAAX protease family)